MGTAFIPLCAIIAVLIIAFLFASLPQVSLKTRYSVLYTDVQRRRTKNILSSACAFAEHSLIVAPLITIQPKDTCSQQDLMYFVCSAFFNMGKKRSDVASFLYQVFPLYFPSGENTLTKKMPGLERLKERREKEYD